MFLVNNHARHVAACEKAKEKEQKQKAQETVDESEHEADTDMEPSEQVAVFVKKVLADFSNAPSTNEIYSSKLKAFLEFILERNPKFEVLKSLEAETSHEWPRFEDYIEQPSFKKLGKETQKLFVSAYIQVC